MLDKLGGTYVSRLEDFKRRKKELMSRHPDLRQVPISYENPYPSLSS